MDTKRTSALIGALFCVSAGTAAHGEIRITEWMYTGTGGEFVELTNVGLLPIDMTGWSYDDVDAVPGSFDLSGFGTVDPGESVIIAEDPAATFITAWGLTGIDVLGDNTHNLGRSDEINIFDATNTLADRLTYGDQVFLGSIRTQDESGWVSFDGLGANDVYEWTLSFVGDVQGSYASLNGDIGNPGTHIVPEPATITLLALGGLLGVRRRR